MSSLDHNEPGLSESRTMDLERCLREIPMTPATRELDARVLGEIRSGSDCSCDHSAGAAKRNAVGGHTVTVPSASQNQSRNNGVVSAGWLACAASLVIGAVVGNQFIPTMLRPPQGSSSTEPVLNADLTDQSVQRTTNSVSDASSWTLENAMQVGSKIIESSRFSPSVGAVAWEQQSGEIFRVGTHQADRRFAMCRECHRVGG